MRKNIIRQVPQMKNELEAKIEKALQHLLEQAGEDGLLAKAKQKVVHKRQVKKEAGEEQQGQEQEDRTEQEEAEQRQMPQEMRIIKSILSEVG